MKTIQSLLVLGSCLAAQDPLHSHDRQDSGLAAKSDPSVLTSSRAGFERAFADPDMVLFDRPKADGPLWALGSNYKASFDDRGFTFTGRPRAGATEIRPLRFDLADVRVAGQPLPLGPARLQQRDRRMAWERGPVVETVDIAGRGVQQQFTFPALPKRGDLVVSVAVDTALRGENTTDGVRFVGAHDEIGYSQAIAIDGDGDSIVVPTTWADGKIVITVPAAFVAAASLPLRIDPWVTSLAVTQNTNDLATPDVAWDATGQVWGVVWSRYFGGSDWDCFLQRVSDTVPMQPVGTPVVVDVTGAAWVHARIANLQLFSEFGVVAQVRNGNTGPWQIWSRMIANSGNVVTDQFAVTNTGVDELHPDIGGDPTTEARAAFFAVVWEHAHNASDHDIHATQLFPTGGAGNTVFVQTSIFNQRWPAISKSNGGGPSGSQRWGIVWQETQFPGNEDIWGAMMLWNGVLVPVNGSTVFPIDFSSSNDERPQVGSPTLPAADGSRHLLVAWQRTDSNAGDILAASFDQNGVIRARGNLNALHTDAARLAWPQAIPHVDCDGDRAFVAYHEVFQGNTQVNDLDARVLLVGCGNGQLFVEDGTATAASGNREFNVRVASRYSGSGQRSPRACIVNDRDNSAAGFGIDAVTYDGLPAPSFRTRATACGGLSITASGSTMLGGTAMWSLGVANGPAGFLVGAPANLPIGACPGCVLGVDGTTFLANTFALTIPLERSFTGVTLAVQGFEVRGGGPCLQRVHLSDTVDCRVQ